MTDRSKVFSKSEIDLPPVSKKLANYLKSL